MLRRLGATWHGRAGLAGALVVCAVLAIIGLTAEILPHPSDQRLPDRGWPAMDSLRSTFGTSPESPEPAPIAPLRDGAPLALAIGALPPIEARTLLIALHLLGVSFGLGGATMLDFWVLRWMRWGYLPNDIVRTFGFVSKAVTVGLTLLWLSGIGFLTLYAVSAPEKLANPKLLAKLVIVLCLTVNGVVVHRSLLPHVERGAARPMLGELSASRRVAFVMSGALSAISWYGAFVLGLLHEFNGRVAGSTLISAWLAAWACLSVATAVALRVFARSREEGRRPAETGAIL